MGIEGAVYLGIDFSGGAASWKARCARPTVWIARVEGGPRPSLVDLCPVQELPGKGEPFDRLVALLRAGAFAAAGIDAPFAIPTEHLPPGGQPELLARIGALPPAEDRPFPRGAEILALAKVAAPGRKTLRVTEQQVKTRYRVNTRSTVWDGPRGGAPFAAACLTLLARAERPIWPWRCGPGMLVEAFPAAQLKSWRLPHQGYSKIEQTDVRKRILEGLDEHLAIPAVYRETLSGIPDALDAVVAAFAGIAAERIGAPVEPPADGLIAILDEAGADPRPPIAVVPHTLLEVSIGTEPGEVFEDILCRPGVRLERIVSRGHTTGPTVQGHDEWVLILDGSARLIVGEAAERSLMPGEHLLIPAGVPHRVTHTADPTIWLAVHFGEDRCWPYPSGRS